jgi:hypothetical protein
MAAVNAPAITVAVTTKLRCVVCFDAFEPEYGVSCDDGHFLCGGVHGDDCLGKHARVVVMALRRTKLLAAQAEAAEAAIDTRRLRELAGAVHCPVPGCGALAFTDAQIFGHVSGAVFVECNGAKVLLPVAREASRIFDVIRAKDARRIVELQLQTLLPYSRQCGRCGMGPVDFDGCEDLGAHHDELCGEARINNSCQKCGWFAESINDWPRWNGQHPHDEAEADGEQAAESPEAEMTQVIFFLHSFLSTCTCSPFHCASNSRFDCLEILIEG